MMSHQEQGGLKEAREITHENSLTHPTFPQQSIQNAAKTSATSDTTDTTDTSHTIPTVPLLSSLAAQSHTCRPVKLHIVGRMCYIGIYLLIK